MALILLVTPALAPAIPAGAQPPFEGKGRVISLDMARGTVTLDHGPIPGLMPPMRMRFPVERAEDLGKLKPGDAVRFSLGSKGDEVAIETIDRLEDPQPTPR